MEKMLNDAYGLINSEDKYNNLIIHISYIEQYKNYRIDFSKNYSLKIQDNFTELVEYPKSIEDYFNSKNWKIEWLNKDDYLVKLNEKNIEMYYYPLNQYGLIESNDKYNGWYVIIETLNNEGDAYVFVQNNINRSKSTDGYDNWFESVEYARLDIYKNDWKIIWLDRSEV